MRLDARRKHFRKRPRLRVYFNGVEQRRASAVDTRLGRMRVAYLDKDGLLQINPRRTDEVWERIRYGRVTVR